MTTDLLGEKRGKAKTIEKGSVCGAIHSNKKKGITTNESALPLDVVEVIAKRLNVVFDYLHFRATDRNLPASSTTNSMECQVCVKVQ